MLFRSSAGHMCPHMEDNINHYKVKCSRSQMKTPVVNLPGRPGGTSSISPHKHRSICYIPVKLNVYFISPKVMSS
jgi:hypothetical protein